MEAEIHTSRLPLYKSKESAIILEKLEDIIDAAEEIRDRDDVNDPELRQAMKIVEDFLRIKKRVCYGGTAINAQLPNDKKIYDFTKELPDYDFYTPTPSKDAEELSYMLKKAGMTNTSIRLGVNKGTIKVSVNFNPIADLTYKPFWVYKEVLKKAYIEDGIHYADADFLRMNMYLELSRPRASVDRWKKVYERLLLLSDIHKINLTSCPLLKNPMKIPSDIHKILIDYVIDNELIFIGADVEAIYKSPEAFKESIIDNSTHTVICLSPDPNKDVDIIRKKLEEVYDKKDLHVLRLKQIDDRLHSLAGITYEDSLLYLPTISGVLYKDTIVFLALEYTICHSYNEVMYKEKPFHIASLDTCIYIFYLLSYVNGLNGIVPYSFECFAKRLVYISQKTRDKNMPGIYPLFSISCSGEQPQIRSLLKDKSERVKAYKAAEKIRKLQRTFRYRKQTKKKKAQKKQTKTQKQKKAVKQ